MDYHKILGVTRGTPKNSIKKAYWKLAKKYHPDVNPSKNANTKFIEITEAYEVLVEGRKPQVSQSYNAPPDVDPFVKYKNVYAPPKDKEEYKEWLKVAKARAQRLSEVRYRNLQGTIKTMSKWRRVSLVPAWVSFVLCSFFIVDSLIEESRTDDVIIEKAGKKLYTKKGYSVKVESVSSYVVGEEVSLKHSPILGIVSGISGHSFYKSVPNFYSMGAYYCYILFGVSLVLIVKKRYYNANFFSVFYFMIMYNIIMWVYI